MAVEFLKSEKIENLYKEIENKRFFFKNKKKNIDKKVLKKYHHKLGHWKSKDDREEKNHGYFEKL